MYHTERLKELREYYELTPGINEIKASHIIKFAKFYKVTSDYILGLTDKK